MRLFYQNIPENKPYDFEISEANVQGFNCKNKTLEITFKRSGNVPAKKDALSNWTWTGETDLIINYRDVIAYLNTILKQTLSNNQQSLF